MIHVATDANWEPVSVDLDLETIRLIELPGNRRVIYYYEPISKDVYKRDYLTYQWFRFKPVVI